MKKYFFILIYILCFFSALCFAEENLVNENMTYLDIAMSDNYGEMVCVVDCVSDERFLFFDEKNYNPILEKLLLDNFYDLNYFYSVAFNRPLVIALDGNLLYFINNSSTVKYFPVKNFDNLTYSDKVFILENCVYLPGGYSWADVPYYKSLVEKAGYGVNVSSNVVESFTKQEFVDMSVWFEMLWSGDRLFFGDEFSLLKQKQRGFSYKDLQNIRNLKNKVLAQAKIFFNKFPEKWKMVVYPYNRPVVSLIANNDLSNYLKDISFPSNNFSYPDDIGLAVAKSFEQFTLFKSSSMPNGIITEIDVLHMDLFPMLSLRDNEIIINNIESSSFPVLKFVDDDSSIYVLNKNLDFILNLTSFWDRAEQLVDEEWPIVFVWDLNTLTGINNRREIIENLFNYVPENIGIVDINKILLKNKLINFDKRGYIIDDKNINKYIGSTIQNTYWGDLLKVRLMLEDYQNSGFVDEAVFNKTFDMVLRLESGFWYDETFLAGRRDECFYNTIRSIEESLTGKVSGRIDASTDNVVAVVEYTDISVLDDKNGFEVTEALGDDYGDGDYVYPLDPSFEKGVFDLKSFGVHTNKDYLIFSVGMASLINPDNAPLGFSFPQIDIYIDLNHRLGLGKTSLLPGRNAFVKPEDAWEYCISVNGWETLLYKMNIEGTVTKLAKLDVYVDDKSSKINIYAPKNILKGDVLSWGYLVCVSGYDMENADRIMNVNTEPDERSFGGRRNEYVSNIIDVLLPKGLTQVKVMDQSKNKPVELPAFRVRQ